MWDRWTIAAALWLLAALISRASSASEECLVDQQHGMMTSVSISPHHRELYQRQGHIQLEGVLSDMQLERWRSMIDGAVQARGDRKFSDSAPSDTADATNEDLGYFDKVFTQKVNLWHDGEAMRQMVVDDAGAELGRIASALTGKEYRLWHDQALYKEAYANPTSWHVDVPYWSFNSSDAISAWVALDDATESNGCLHFLSGSHSIIGAKDDPFAEVKIGKNMDALFDVHPELRTLEPVAVPVVAGSVSFHNGLTAHAAGPNMTPYQRRAMSFQLMPIGDNRFNGKQNILSRAYFESLQIGDVLDRDDVNPRLGGAR